MNKPLSDAKIQDFTQEELQEALQNLLKSRSFSRAKKLAKIMIYLTENFYCLSKSEYQLGIELFNRNVATYSTLIDPTVRVHFGRLRKKLDEYYKNIDNPVKIKFVLPVGKYRLQIERVAPPAIEKNDKFIVLHPVKIVAFDNGYDRRLITSFCYGLGEELIYRLFIFINKNAGVKGFRLKNLYHETSGDFKSKEGHRFDVKSIMRVEPDLFRIDMYLLDHATGSILWNMQLDNMFNLSIKTQENMAKTLCNSLCEALISLV